MSIVSMFFLIFSLAMIIFWTAYYVFDKHLQSIGLSPISFDNEKLIKNLSLYIKMIFSRKAKLHPSLLIMIMSAILGVYSLGVYILGIVSK